MFQIKFAKQIKTHVYSANFSDNPAFYKLMRKHMVESERSQMKVSYVMEKM